MLQLHFDGVSAAYWFGLGGGLGSVLPERIERLEHKKGAVGSYEFKSFEVDFKVLQARLRMIP